MGLDSMVRFIRKTWTTWMSICPSRSVRRRLADDDRHRLAGARLAGASGYVIRYSGADATLGLAFAHAGVLYPFFGTLLGWVGTALTGTDAASNVLFGSLQKISAQQLGLAPVLMAAANSSGGVMGQDD
jgi:lactate permease